VVRDDGGSIRFRHALVRTLLATIEIWLAYGVLASLACIVTRRGKRLGDLLAGTYVVHERSAIQTAPPVLMPPELAGWASQADLRALPGNLALVARTFLQRGSAMRPAPRARLSMQLAAAVEPYVAPPAPEGTHPERFLAAVLAERRDREYMLELRDRRADHDEAEAGLY
jgi:RDD domain protein